MSTNKLPTYLDIGKHYLSVFNINIKNAIILSLNIILEIWYSASLHL